ncbi:proton-coupled zinc antiporter SLC30A2-like isoform X1 [Phycodurus eques]|uniref:proton-coupled zinc antiporter SLC30A2-like isoform X1 n=2 Tax=Phycodurus eques TaxID=693459 RepID=UPI002ACED76C|nr:proton-coupled zinc antiporter SLC30A2-like isoform X1 [Phycodurus eques]XP_061551667.1 proton-coupled zinc antiporter SLC30A2-like isoform X1 [Phycodurus eques]
MAAESEKQLLLESLSCSESDGGEDVDWYCGDGGELVDARESGERRLARKRLLVALVISFVFMVAEVVGGYAAHSLAIMTDAAHLLSDVGSISLSVFSLWISGRTPTLTLTFGWHRAEILGTLLSLSSIWAVTAVLVWSAALRIAAGDYDVDADVMLLTSVCGVAVNILILLILHQSGVSHTHNHALPSNRPQKPEERRGPGHRHGNASVKAACIHAVGDLIQSVGVLLAAAIIHFWPECKAADPICTLLFSLVVMWTTFPTARDVIRVLMDGAPPGISVASVRDALLSVRGASSLHRLHVWSLDMTHSLLCVHITAEDGADPHVILKRATKLLRSHFGFTAVTIQVEPSGTSRDNA